MTADGAANQEQERPDREGPEQEKGTSVSEQPAAGNGDEPAPAQDRSALAEDDIDFAEAFKRATGRCPLGATLNNTAPAQDNNPA
jgi:hypothetical protein